jgi:hypothetical protein
MKLTKQKLYKLILEAIGEKQYGFGFAGFLQIPMQVYMDENDMLDVDYLEAHIGEKIGAGYSRMVFAIDDEHVAKIAHRHPDDPHMRESFEEGCKSNRLEYQIFNKYPNVFPKSYGIFKEDSVLVTERIIPISDNVIYGEVLRNAFPSLDKAAKMLSKGGFKERDDVSVEWVFERVLDAYSEGLLSQPSEEWMDVLSSTRAGRKVEDVDKYYLATEAWHIATNDENLAIFMSVNRQLGVDFDELRIGNLGTNKERNILVSIDISIF